MLMNEKWVILFTIQKVQCEYIGFSFLAIPLSMQLETTQVC